jgi:hypothetical protein
MAIIEHTHTYMRGKGKERHENYEACPDSGTALHIIIMDLIILPVPSPNKALKIVKLHVFVFVILMLSIC